MLDAMGREELERAAAKLNTALRLFETGLAMKRAQILRAHPAITEADLKRRLGEWLRTRPGAEHGDAEGQPRGRLERAG
jgi:hypothetical protein